MDCGSRLRGGDLKGEDLIDGEVLGGEDTVEAFEGEGSFLIEEIRDMGLLKTGLMGETAAGEGASVDAAEELEAEEFVQILEVHGEDFLSANHIIRQDEDKAKYLLYAIRIVAYVLIEERLVTI
jgi:hypothetical protein